MRRILRVLVALPIISLLIIIYPFITLMAFGLTGEFMSFKDYRESLCIDF